MERRLAVIDCGSNSFRLVVFTYTDTWWKRTDEIYEAVRVGEGLEATGELQPEPGERAGEGRGGRGARGGGGGPRAAPGGSRWSARWRRSSSTRTSAAPPGSTR